MYDCPRCQKLFKDKFALETHLTQNKICTMNNLLYERKSLFHNNENVCKWCGKLYSKKSSLIIHLDNTESKCYAERKAKIEAKKKEEMIVGELKEIKNSISNIEKKSLGNNITNNVSNNVFIVKPGEECIKHITKELMLRLLGNYSFIDFSCELVKLTYFNLKVRKNCGWCIAYPKNGKAGLEFNHEMGGFERKSTVDVIDDKFANLLSLLQPLIEEINREDELLDNLNQYQKRNIKEFYAHY